MRRSFTFIAAGILSVMAAAAQTNPRIETYLGYTYMRATHRSTPDAPPFSLNGGGGQFVYNVNKSIGVVADLGATVNSAISDQRFDSTFFNFTFGPRYSWRHSRFTPYGQALFGGAYVTQSAPILAVPVLPLAGPFPVIIDPGLAVIAHVTQDQTGFAMSFGGGVNITLTKHIQFRPAEVSFYQTRFGNLRTTSDSIQNYFRYSGGFNFTFGAQ